MPQTAIPLRPIDLSAGIVKKHQVQDPGKVSGDGKRQATPSATNGIDLSAGIVKAHKIVPRETNASKSQGNNGVGWLTPLDVSAVNALGLKPEKVKSFGDEIVKGMGFDPGKIQASGGVEAQWKEVGKEAWEGLRNMGVSILKDPLNVAKIPDQMANNIEDAARTKNYGKMVGALSQVAAGMEAPEAAGDAAAAVGTTADIAKGIARAPGKIAGEVAGRGASMERLQAAKDINGLALKSKLATVEQMVRKDASATLDDAVKRMDAAHPQGLISKAALAHETQAITQQLREVPEAIPTPLKDLMDEPASPLGSASVFRGAGQVARRGNRGVSAEEAISTMQPEVRQRFLDSLSNEERETLEGPNEVPASGEGWSASQVQRIRTKLYEIGYTSKGSKYSGIARASARNGHSLLSQILGDAAAKAGISDDWRGANRKWATYKQAFDGKWERKGFQPSPIGKALSGQTADDIMGPITGKGAQQVRDLLGQYRRFGADSDTLRAAANRHQMLSGIERVSHMSRYEFGAPLLYLVHPSLFAGYAISRMLGIPIFRWLKTRKVNPENVRGLAEVAPKADSGIPSRGELVNPNPVDLEGLPQRPQ